MVFFLFQSFAANGNAEDSYDNGYDFGSMPKYAGQYGGIAESFTNMAEVKPDTDTGKPRILLMGLRRLVEKKPELYFNIFLLGSSYWDILIERLLLHLRNDLVRKLNIQFKYSLGFKTRFKLFMINGFATRIWWMFFFRSGKSSIQKVVFHKMSPNETLFLESTNKITKEDISNSSFVRFSIWDFPGQVIFRPIFFQKMTKIIGVWSSLFSDIVIILNLFNYCFWTFTFSSSRSTSSIPPSTPTWSLAAAALSSSLSMHRLNFFNRVLSEICMFWELVT